MSGMFGVKAGAWGSTTTPVNCIHRGLHTCPRTIRTGRHLASANTAVSTEEQRGVTAPVTAPARSNASATLLQEPTSQDSPALNQLQTKYSSKDETQEAAAAVPENGDPPNRPKTWTSRPSERPQAPEQRTGRYQQNDNRYNGRAPQNGGSGGRFGGGYENRGPAGQNRNDQRRFNGNQAAGNYTGNNQRQSYNNNGPRQSYDRRGPDNGEKMSSMDSRNLRQDPRKILKPLIPGVNTPDQPTIERQAPAATSTDSPAASALNETTASPVAPSANGSTPAAPSPPGLMQKPTLLQKPTLKKPEPPPGLVRPQMPPRVQPPRPARRTDPRNVRIIPEGPGRQDGSGRPQQQQRWQPGGQRGQQQQQQQPQQQQGAAASGQTPGQFKVVILEETEDDKKAVKAKPAVVRGKGGRKVVTAEMKRAGRLMRKEVRESKKVVRDKEEVFEVGEEGMSVPSLAEMLNVNDADIITNLFMKGIVCTANQMLDKNTVKLVAKEFDVLVLDKEEAKLADAAKKNLNSMDEEDLENLTPRPPVVTVMGHVDHGKTSLLDFIRKSRVALGEAGGITQQIGAYTTQVEVEGDTKTICFLDTPGHEAFSAMRARGARVTDVSIIIVAADDGVQPQTREAISHAQAAEVPIVVAINKVDKPGADVDRVKQQLLELNLVPEEWGGKVPMVPISAKKGDGVDELLLNVLLVSEELDLMANSERSAKGTVIEAHMDKKVGAVATLLVQAGTLKTGDVVSTGTTYGKVRSMVSSSGLGVTSAGPSEAVLMYGLNSVPTAGDLFEVCKTEAEAKKKAALEADALKTQRQMDMMGGGSMVTLASLASFEDDQMETIQKINVVIKGDTMGVVEAIKSALNQLPQDSVVLRYLWTGAGEITNADVDLCAASGGLLLAFNLSPSEAVSTAAKQKGVQVRPYRVIYDLIDDVRAAMEGKLPPVEERIDIGKAEVKAVFGTGSRKVAGCAVLEGRLRKGCSVIVRRKKQIAWQGTLSSLRRVKDVVDEVAAGLECGVGADDYLDWQEGDMIEAFETVQKVRKLEDARAKNATDLAQNAED